uniref:Tripartite motif-containing protein 15-like n=1 Tax=Petromyzon marinus TaxID=7757 RepID=A0AAJ7XHN2_PETMA|nr:tripartite motif-containing protein 15-like [Petromyzon marinus]
MKQSAEDFIGQMITEDQEGNWKDIKRELPELREWIGKTPSLFLHELKRRNVVTEEEYWKAFTIPTAAMRVDSILLPVMIRGEGKRRELLETLEQQRSRERHFLDMLKTSHVCSPTLNPNSAHQQLQISADLSTVTWNQEEQPYSDHIERFEWWPIVLCFETFSSGDHYWEVDVRASRNCSIGVARESIPRNRHEKSGRLGWNEQSWAFIQWDSNYSARHGDQSIPYPEIKHLQRVGVHLDFNAGKLSFYNGNTMELLHSFNDIPSGPLCPAMQVKSGSVTIYEAQTFKNLTVDESREDIQICDHFANSGVHRTNNTDEEKGERKDALLRTRMEEPSVARELIGRSPAMLHHELLVQGLITQSELSEVYSLPRASARADFIIRRLDRKQEESPQLKGILHQHRKKQEAFLKMRRESSTCSPTLNPNTAHWNLQISADLKTVRTSTHTQHYPDNSDRFDHYQVVICSEKFSSGRHYWEVDVRGCEKFIIGVTYDAIPRKGDAKAL